VLNGDPPPSGLRHYALPAELELAPRPRREIPIWVASWGSRAGLARVTRAGDGWLASAYNTSPERFAAARAELKPGFPCALATMWTWIADDPAAAERMLTDVLAPFLGRDPDVLRGQVCVGSIEHCAQLLSRYAAAGCRRVYLWPLGDEQRQLERIAGDVVPLITPA
jgi:alkanesulfonate monooxygenase SsuD/methylene tetrahydromethanopterin reductase-like flavin-dependent oxidoreductase (luciferase family)